MAYKWNGKEVSKAFKEAVVKGAIFTAESILNTSDQLVPRDTGTLARSGFVDADKGATADTKEVTIGYGTPYAYRQHEDLSFNHPKQGQAKFLEIAWNNHIKELNKNIIRESKRANLDS